MQIREEVGRQREFIVAVLQSGNVVYANVVELKIRLGCVDLIQPRFDVQGIEVDHVPLPLVWCVVLRVETREFHEVDDLLVRGKLRKTQGGCAQEYCYKLKFPH